MGRRMVQGVTRTSLALLIWNLNWVHMICLPSLVFAVACTLKVPVGALPVSRDATMVWGPALRGQGWPAFWSSAHTSPL